MCGLEINLERIKEDLLELSRFGFNETDRGVYRPGFSEADMQARKWLLEKMAGIGLSATLDGAANVIGRAGKSGRPAVVVGSHLDSVPCGGIFDGALGVIAGLECLRTIKEKKLNTRHPLELIAFSDEEGRFGGMLGSQAIAGQVTPDWLENAKDPDGNKLADVMRKRELEPLEVLTAYREPDTLHAFLELHIEQGPVLEKIGKPIGIVEGIAGVFVWIVHLIGKADHSGTAPMNMRSDAFMGLADFAHEIPRIIDEEGTDKSRLTVGKVELKPGAPHTVPGEVVFTLVGRDLKGEVMEQIANACRKVLSALARRHNLMFEYEEMSWLDPHLCHADIIESFSRTADELGLDYQLMPSGAGHDTQCMTAVTRSGMIFVPSVGGVSHAPDEWTHWSDVERGTNLLLNTMLYQAEVRAS